VCIERNVGLRSSNRHRCRMVFMWFLVLFCSLFLFHLMSKILFKPTFELLSQSISNWDLILARIYYNLIDAFFSFFFFFSYIYFMSNKGVP
jgi:hypothetical protein